MQEYLVEVKNLKKYYPVKAGIFSKVKAWNKAVDGVSFGIYRGETLGLVGESGCGKTTTGKCILCLEEPTDGEVLFEGKNIFELDREELRHLRREMQIIFQDPYGSLNPRMTVGDIIGEAFTIHGIASGKERTEKVEELLEVVGLSPYHAKRYPHEFSGGQRQRIGIARALALRPKLIVCDEPVSALDVSIQSQILNLLNDLQDKFGLTYLFIAHNLSVVQHISDRVGVMYLGRLVELADSDELYSSPRHPYTVALLSAVPIPDPDVRKKRIVLEGDVPSSLNPPPGCTFHTRCPRAVEECEKIRPEWREVSPGHFVACHLV
ncbi:MAG: dipeptide ABC transporter ATP-binding protein [Candidatus Fermentithermobacillus carboniphilus]|uniref:Dipeptide ABC transporter ATP-binding protein n=1 Tax=Candidatus Fermentithermobacillus carboniphilus TaxID=3085328 RepID=A0AAT9LC78_9FIRM|nr:MAG: dipeptide ABC transporter ATP-binding protein [Candidatus Fermentithermobacillus carboniphilus]